jgi:hypothetical protein
MTNTYNTLNPLGSTAPKDLFDNASNFDEAMNSASPSFYDRFSKRRETWSGMQKMVADFLEAMGFEATHLQYVDGVPLQVDRPTQLIDRAPSVYKVKAPATFPVNLTGTWATDQLLLVDVGDASLRSELASADGSTFIGFGDRTVFEKLGEHISCKDAPFNCVGDGVADDTAGLIAFAAYVDSVRQSGPTTSGPLTSSYTGTFPTAYIPPGTYLKNGAIPWGPYTKIVGDNAIIKEIDNDTDGFVVDQYQFEMSGVQFVGGRHHLVFSNANINSSMIKVDYCQFFLSRSYSIKTFATGGTFTHMSCNATFNNCRWISNNKVMDNCCDSMVINDAWVQPSVTNLTASTAQFNNKGASATDLDAQTRLFFNRGFFIPDVGTFGVDRPANIRWVDNWGSFISHDVRYGGEFAGMRIVDHLAVMDTALPWNTTEVTIRGGLVFCGPDADTTACIVGLQGQAPQRMNIGGFSGTVSSPIVRNLSSLDLPAYYAAFETATGRSATEYFKYDISDIITNVRAFSPTRPMLPNEMYKYLIRGRNTRVATLGTPPMTNGSANNIISFGTTPEYDAVLGAFVAATPSHLIMPNGCSKMRIEVEAVLDAGDSLAKAITVQLQDSGGTRWKGVSAIYGYDGKANPFGDSIHFTADVYGVPDSYWQLNIKHNGTTNRNLLSCRVIMTPLDMII